MKASSRIAALSALFLLIAISTRAQNQLAAPQAEAQSCVRAPFVVYDAPYSAVREEERSQTLLDGSQVQRKGRVAQIYRNSQGWEREEFFRWEGPAGAHEDILSMIVIFDPAQCIQYTLLVKDHVARRKSFLNSAASRGMQPGGSAIGASPQPPHHDIPEELRPKHSSESMGTQTMEGLLVEGWKSTTTIPTGAEGNDRPMVVVHENWTSPDLKILVLREIIDPRQGETTIRLTNIARVEPDPALFSVPADYTIKEE